MQGMTRVVHARRVSTTWWTAVGGDAGEVLRRSDCHRPTAAKGRAVVSSSGRPSVK